MALALLSGCEGTGFLKNTDDAPSASTENGDAGEDQAMVMPRPGVRPTPPRDANRNGNIAAHAVVGGSEAEVSRILGEPTTVRNEPPAMVWHYAATSCKLDVFFYFDIRNKDFRALSYKFYPDIRSMEDEDACLSNIRTSAAR